MLRISSGDRGPARTGGVVASVAGVPLSSGARLARRFRFGRPVSVLAVSAGGNADTGVDDGPGENDDGWEN
ncbi:hypothetical protein, partial [Frankia sp. Cr1]|uniref:hypothetical protein n=1 Tax=Frankia sp. Cr1 TaxID=3073931 RepID=UPI002AD5017D